MDTMFLLCKSSPCRQIRFVACGRTMGCLWNSNWYHHKTCSKRCSEASASSIIDVTGVPKHSSLGKMDTCYHRQRCTQAALQPLQASRSLITSSLIALLMTRRQSGSADPRWNPAHHARILAFQQLHNIKECFPTFALTIMRGIGTRFLRQRAISTNSQGHRIVHAKCQ